MASQHPGLAIPQNAHRIFDSMLLVPPFLSYRCRHTHNCPTLFSAPAPNFHFVSLSFFCQRFTFAITDKVLWSPVCHLLKHTGEWQSCHAQINCRFLKSPLTLAVCLQSFQSSPVNHACLRRDYLRTDALKRRLVFQLILFLNKAQVHSVLCWPSCYLGGQVRLAASCWFALSPW